MKKTVTLLYDELQELEQYKKAFYELDKGYVAVRSLGSLNFVGFPTHYQPRVNFYSKDDAVASIVAHNALLEDDIEALHQKYDYLLEKKDDLEDFYKNKINKIPRFIQKLFGVSQ